jgi:hypothetical protein
MFAAIEDLAESLCLRVGEALEVQEGVTKLVMKTRKSSTRWKGFVTHGLSG